MKVLNIGDTYDDFIEVFVKLSDDDKRVEIAKKLDGKDYNSSCFMVNVFYKDDSMNITGMLISYIPNNGGLYEIGVIENNSQDWKIIEKFMCNSKYIDEVKKLHEDGECNCDYENDCMCLYKRYEGDSIDYDDFLEELISYL